MAACTGLEALGRGLCAGEWWRLVARLRGGVAGTASGRGFAGADITAKFANGSASIDDDASEDEAEGAALCPVANLVSSAGAAAGPDRRAVAGGVAAATGDVSMVSRRSERE